MVAKGKGMIKVYSYRITTGFRSLRRTISKFEVFPDKLASWLLPNVECVTWDERTNFN